MKKSLFLLLTGIFCSYLFCGCNDQKQANSLTGNIPLPEHPRPDFERAEWENLNGHWAFTFDEKIAQEGITAGTSKNFDKKILVPFPWGSKLSEVEDLGDIAWYGREITVPKSWQGKRVFLVIGASDWETTAWFNGQKIGTNQGGYTPFEFELKDVKYGTPQQIFIKVDDTSNDAHLYGKQGYGNARGIWQTIYLEARGDNYIKYVHFTPDIDNSKVTADVALDKEPENGSEIKISFKNKEQEAVTKKIDASQIKTNAAGDKSATIEIPLKEQHLWSLEDPYLYEMSVELNNDGNATDKVNTYFGQRKISVVPLPGLDFPYIALNNKPVYLQLCLDQSYHPDGFYTFPSDEFMKNEIMISKKLGLNGNRVHIKVEIPRKLYWADKLGLLIMADTPNFWGEPTSDAQKDWEHCMRNQVCRDYNHPSIFAWVNFNETWGLFTNVKDDKKQDGKKREYTKETQEWVRSMYHLTKSLDKTRLVEDNSPCNNDHVESDINSWHNYNPGYRWEKQTALYDKETYEGSTFNYIGGNKQNGAPMMNSECGNVWGYAGSAGDCDYTWDYHLMINSFRIHPKVCGWLYTEHHDVINEWNGYVRFDRSPKYDGLGDLVPGMTMADFQSLYYIVPLRDLCTDVKGGSKITVPLYASFMTDKNPGTLSLSTQLIGWNQLGEEAKYGEAQETAVPFEAYMSKKFGEVCVTIPETKGLYLLQMTLHNDKNEVLGRNFVTFDVKDGKQLNIEKTKLLAFEPASYVDKKWSVKETNVMKGLKVNGFGHGYFEYQITWPTDVNKDDIKSAELVFEASSKQIFGKDVSDVDSSTVDLGFMLGGGTHDPCKNPNAYAMTDDNIWKSKIDITVNGKNAGSYDLADDPADHRGILSWHAQLQDDSLREAGSYGYLVKAKIPLDALKQCEPITIRIAVPESENGGVAIYGKDFGRYPLDPTIILIKN